MKVDPGMTFRLALLLLIATTHNIGFVDGLSHSGLTKGGGGQRQQHSGEDGQKGLLEAWLSSQLFNNKPSSVGQASQRPISFFPSQSKPTGSHPTRSFSQSDYRSYSGSRNEGRGSGQGRFGSAPSSVPLLGSNYKPYSSSKPSQSSVQSGYRAFQGSSKMTLKPRSSNYNPASHAIPVQSSYLSSPSQSSVKQLFGQNSHQQSPNSQTRDQSRNEHSSENPFQGRQIIQGSYRMLQNQHSHGGQSHHQTQTNSMPVITSKPSIYKPSSARGVVQPRSQSLFTASTSSSLSPRLLRGTFIPINNIYQSSISNRKAPAVSRPVGGTKGLASTTKSGQQSEHQSPPASSSHSSFSPRTGKVSPKSFHTSHSVQPTPAWFDTVQNWNPESANTGNSHQVVYLEKPGRVQMLQVSRPAQDDYQPFQNPLSSSGAQQSMWKPAASVNEVQNLPPLNLYRHDDFVHSQQSSKPVQNNAWFFPGSIPTGPTAKPQILQPSNQMQSNHQSFPSRLSLPSVAQHAEKPQQSQYLTKPGQNWYQLSSDATSGQSVKPVQSQQTFRPAQGNYHVSQSRLPASSVGHYAGSWKPAQRIPAQENDQSFQNPSSSFGAQHSMWKPEASVNHAQNLPPTSLYRHDDFVHSQQSSKPVQNYVWFFPGNIPTRGGQHAQHTEKPQQSQYLTRPGQNLHQLSSDATSGQFAKPVQVQQALRPAQGNYHVSQSRLPASSVGQHAGSRKPADAVKPVHSGQQQTSFPNSHLSMTEWIPQTLISSQDGFNDQVLNQLTSNFKPGSHVRNNNYGFKPSQSSKPSSHSGGQSVKNIYKPQPSRIPPVQSTSKPVWGTNKEKGSQQQSQLSIAYPDSYLSAHSYSSGQVVPHGMASGNSKFGAQRGQTKG